MKKDLKFALVGCGKIAPRHAVEMAKHGKLMAVCDVVREKADQFASAYGAKAYYSIDELLKNETGIDLIAICTPNGMHAEHCIKSAQAGVDVLCEKPLCLTSSGAWQMVETARLCRKQLYVVKSTRFNPALQQLKTIISEGQLGNIYSFQLNCFWNRPDSYYSDWRGKIFPDGGTLYTQFSHYIDAMLWLLGDVESVTGFRRNAAHTKSVEFEDTGAVALLMKSGAVGGINWSVNTFEKNMEVSFTIIGEKGTISIGGGYMNEIKYQCTSGAEINLQAKGSANDYGSYKGSMSNHDKVYENLVRAINDDGHPFTNAFDGLKTVELIEKIYNSVPLS